MLALEPGTDGSVQGVAVQLFGIIAVVGALALSAGVWAWGHRSGGHQAEANGKKGVLVSAGAALLLGAANGVVAAHLACAAGRCSAPPS